MSRVDVRAAAAAAAASIVADIIKNNKLSLDHKFSKKISKRNNKNNNNCYYYWCLPIKILYDIKNCQNLFPSTSSSSSPLSLSLSSWLSCCFFQCIRYFEDFLSLSLVRHKCCMVVFFFLVYFLYLFVCLLNFYCYLEQMNSTPTHTYTHPHID